jgi:agmatine deiminase
MTYIPPEWAPQRSVWTAFPSNPAEWGEHYAGAQKEIAAMVNHLVGYMPVHVLVRPGATMQLAEKMLDDEANLIEAEIGDIWLRDTGPVFAPPSRGDDLLAHVFRFNGWGGKYVMEGDTEIATFIAEESLAKIKQHPFIMEGGSLDGDGEGTVLTTKQCLLNPNRNKNWTEKEAEASLAALGFEKVLWLDEGLANDHTDGHIDNIARFVAPATVVCQSATGADDPNAKTLQRIEAALNGMTDAKGRKLKVIPIPGPGLFAGKDGKPIPASHMNFFIAEKTVVVPVYNDHGARAVAALTPLFPGRKVVGLPANALLSGGGGAFHCITQQEPRIGGE